MNFWYRIVLSFMIVGVPLLSDHSTSVLKIFRSLLTLLSINQMVEEKSATPANDPSQWVTLDDYPTDTTVEGEARYQLTISNIGRVIDCRITVSSGSDRLDYATCINLTRRARFVPVTDSQDRPLMRSFDGLMRWYLPE